MDWMVLGLLVCVGLCVAGCASELASQPAGEVPSRLRVLFVGNSYTFCNDLPGTVAKLAAAAEPPVDVHAEHFTKGGWSLEMHWNAGGALKRIGEGDWDVVVLQDKSTGPVESPDSMKAHAAKFDAEIRKAGARTVFYMTWARQHIPTMIETLAKEYDARVAELNATVAPVGRAWQAALAERPERGLHVEDKSHPNQHGTYLAACVFYATLTGRDPRGLPNAGLDEVGADDAAFLQRIAWQTVTGR